VNLADSPALVAPRADVPTCVGFEPYLSMLRWQLLIALVQNKTLSPTCQGLWNLTSRFTGQTVEYKYRLNIERNGCAGWSDLSARNGEKTFRIQGSPPFTDGSYQFVLQPIEEGRKSQYFIVAKLSPDLKTLEGQWGTEGFDQPMRGELKGVRAIQTSTAYVDSNGSKWDSQTALIVLLDKIIPQTRLSDSQTVELSSLITHHLNDPNTYEDNLMDLAFILINPLLQMSLLRYLAGNDRPWQRTEYLSLALLRVAALAPFHFRDGDAPPPFDRLFGRNEEGDLTLPDCLPKAELQKMFREHATAQSVTSLQTITNWTLGGTRPDFNGSWESNFIGLIINVLTAGHFIKNEAECVANCLTAAAMLPVNWVTRQLADILVNIAKEKKLDFEPAMRYPVLDFLIECSEKDVWIHRRTVDFFRDSLFHHDVRAHVIWPRGKDALYFTALASRGCLRCVYCPSVAFARYYEEIINLYDEFEKEDFMKVKFANKQIWQRFSNTASGVDFDCQCMVCLARPLNSLHQVPMPPPNVPSSTHAPVPSR